jgi:hypothetical protein
MKQPITKFLRTPEGKELLAQAVKDAVAKQHAAGLPSVGLIDGVVSMRWPDGRVVPVTEESMGELEEVQRRRAGLAPGRP